MSFGNVDRDTSVKSSSTSGGTVARKGTFSEMSAGSIILNNLDVTPSPVGSLVVDNTGRIGLASIEPPTPPLQLQYAGSVLQSKNNNESSWVDVPILNPVIVPNGTIFGQDQLLPNSQLSVAISHDGKSIAFGGNDSSHLRVYFFQSLNNFWNPAGTGIILSPNEDLEKITSMDMSSDALTIAIGVNFDYVPSQGYVKIFTRTPDSLVWNEIQQINGQDPNSRFGTTVALSADAVYLGAHSPTYAGNRGDVNLYTRVGNTYNFVERLEQGSPSSANAEFGRALAIVHNNISGIVTVAVGSSQYVSGVGRTWLHTNATGSFVQKVLTYIEQTTTSNIQYGGSVCISGDGRTVYTSAIGPGALQTFKFELSFPDTWTQTGVILPGNGFVAPGAGYSFGISSSVSSDGTVLAIGALNQAAYVYDSSGKGQYSLNTPNEYGPGRIPLIPGNSFAIKTVVSGNDKSMAVLSSNGCSVFITSLI